MADRKQYAEHRDTQTTVTILSGNTISDVIDSNGMIFVGVNIPATFTSPQIFFQSAPTINGTFQDLYNLEGVQFTAVVQPSRNVRWDIIDFKVDRFVKIVSQETETADRIITLQFAPR